MTYGKKVVRVSAYIEIDMDKIINELIHDGYTLEDIKMDDILYYISNNSTYLKGKGPGVYEVGDGPNIEGFDEYYYDEIEKLLNIRKYGTEEPEP